MDDQRWLDEIDRTWDSVVTTPGWIRGEDAMTETMIRLHLLASEPAPTQAIDRVWTRLEFGTVPRVSRSSQQIRPWRYLRGALDSRPMSAVATVGLLIFITLSGYFAVSHDSAVTTIEDVDYRLFFATEESNRLSEIEPLTLADVPNGQTISASPIPTPPEMVSESLSSSWRASDDGTTLIGLQTSMVDKGRSLHEWRGTVTVVAARTGVVSKRFTLEGDIPESGLVVSASGNRIAVKHGPSIVTDPPQPGVEGNYASWDIYDTASGKLLTTIKTVQDRDPLRSGVGWFDPSGARFYRVAVDRHSLYPGPWPVQLVAHDAETGREIARLDLPNVRAGTWPSGELIDPALCPAIPGTPISREAWGWAGPLWQVYSPGIAMSPDGTMMVFVGPDGREMTTVNLTAMSVHQTMSINGLDHVSTPVAFAEADEDSCRIRVAQQRFVTYSRDGRDVSISGYDVFVIGESTTDVETFSLMRVSVANGNVEARRRVGGHQVQLQYPGGALSPDGQNVYVLVADENGTDVILQRLDADSLDVLAQRKFDSFGGIAIIVK